MSSIGNTISDPSQNFIDPSQRSGPGQVAQQVGADGKPLTAQSCTTGQCGQANGVGSGGSKGSDAAYQRAGSTCGPQGCGSKSTKSSSSCGPQGCGSEKAQKSDCSNGQCDGKKGLFKATVMTVAATELAQLTLDYSQYLS
jgi:hypothetical protein